MRQGIFQFELLTYQSEYQNKDGVENILQGTPMYKKSIHIKMKRGKINLSHMLKHLLKQLSTLLLALII